MTYNQALHWPLVAESGHTRIVQFRNEAKAIRDFLDESPE